jgi:hypothetical protein
MARALGDNIRLNTEMNDLWTDSLWFESYDQKMDFDDPIVERSSLRKRSSVRSSSTRITNE